MDRTQTTRGRDVIVHAWYSGMVHRGEMIMKSKPNRIVSSPRSKQGTGPKNSETVTYGRTMQKTIPKLNKQYVVLPPAGPSNIIVRTASPLPAPRDVESQK